MQCCRYLLFLSMLCLVTLSGCGRSDRHPLGNVAGTVRYNGQPVPAGTIIFEVAGARPAQGKIVDGNIVEVSTYDPQDGVPVGDASIAVFATTAGVSPTAANPAANPGANPGAAIVTGQNYMGAASSLIPIRYNNPATSQLTCKIDEGENVVELELKD